MVPRRSTNPKTNNQTTNCKTTMTTTGDQNADAVAPTADTEDTAPIEEESDPMGAIDKDQLNGGAEESPANDAGDEHNSDGAPVDDADDASPPESQTVTDASKSSSSAQEAAEEARIRAEKFLEEKVASDTVATVSTPSAAAGRSDTAVSPESPPAPKVADRSSSDANGLRHETEAAEMVSPMQPSPTNSSVGLSAVQAALAAADAAAENNSSNADGSSSSSSSSNNNISPIFGPAIGSVVAKHLCKLENKNGTLYLATRAVCFHSTIFGFEQARKVIPLATVVAIVHVGDGGIIVRDESGKTFHIIFQADRDACFNLLLSLHGRASIYKLNCGQLKELGVESADNDDVEKKDLGDESADNGGAANKQLETTAKEALIPHSLSMPVPKSSRKDEGDTIEENYLAACTVANMADDETQCKRSLVNEITKGKISESGRKTAKKYGASDAKSSDELRAEWSKHRDSKTPTYAETVTKGFRLACTLDEYFDLFLSNDSEQYSYGSYQRKLGDSELDVTPWQLSEEDGMSLRRVVSYVHPVNAPMAPPSAAASKTQRFRRWGEHGMCIETRTEVKDVPMTDCFHVDDQILIEPTPDGGVSITSRFEIRFIKRTMFRNIITNTTKGEFVSWFKGYKMMLVDALKERSDGDAKGEQGTETAKEELESAEAKLLTYEANAASSAATTKSEIYLRILLVLVAILVLLQWMMMVQMRATNKAYLEMSANQDRMYATLSQMLEEAARVDPSCDATASLSSTSDV